MVRGRKPVRGGKRKFDKRNERRPKAKRGKFNLREASYVKERDAKNAEIENRRKLLAAEKEKSREREHETSSEEEDEQDPMKALLATFSGKRNTDKAAIESESESEEDATDAERDSDTEQEDLDDEGDPPCQTAADSETEEDAESEDGSAAGEEHEALQPPSVEDDIVVEAKEEDEEDAETAREDAGHVRDPFAIHLNKDLGDELYTSVSSVPQIAETHRMTWPKLGKIVAHIPKATAKDSSSASKETKVRLLEDKQYAQPGRLPEVIDTVEWSKLYVKAQIRGNIAAANITNLNKNEESSDLSPLTPLQKELFSIMNNYQDLLYNERTFSNADEIRFVYCLHVINHVLKTRTKVLHHNAKLSKSKRPDMAEVPDEYRDQGLVRPKILIIVPFRHSCLKIVETLIAILIGEDKGGSVVNKKRFMEDFAGNEISMPKTNPKPEDYEMTFRGNTDDTFKIGISLTKKTLKLYSEFYSSDIIISSVLGLRMTVGAEGEEERDYDFLASMELLVMDQTELFVMQNWDHLLHVLDHLHLQPKNSHDTDFSRVRSWCVNGWTKYYRQTLVFSGVSLPEIHAIFNKRCHNYAGKIKTANPCQRGSVCQVVVQVPQIFHKFEASGISQAIEARMEFFVSKILPQYRDSIMNHTLVYVPSYFDFVKLRNFFKKEELSFVQICEYSKDAKIARARDMFFHSDAHFILYSERFHFFRRIRLKGIRHLVFFAPPTFPHFYSEMCNLMQEANQNPRAGSESNMTVTTIYSKYDAMQLAAIVGTERAAKMIKSEKAIHMLMTGE